MISTAPRFRQITHTQQGDRAGSGSTGAFAFGNIEASAGGVSFKENSSLTFRAFGMVALLMALIPAFFILLEIVTPWPVTKFVEKTCGTICHHIAERTITLRHPMPVCARCAGLYCGWLLAAALFFRIPSPTFDLAERKTKGFLAGLSLLFVAAVLEAGLEAIGWMTLGNWPRLIAGFPLGLFPAFVLLLAMKTLLAEAERSANRSSIRKGIS